MKAMFVTMAVLASAMVAKADGFVCTSESGLVVRVYNHTQPEKGTRTAAHMVISDSSIGAGRKTIAKFDDAKTTLTSKELAFVGNVDLRFADIKRGGENIGGTKLAQLDTIELVVNFSYSSPRAHGEEVSGHLNLNKRNGDVITEEVNCARYLKN